MLAIVVLPVLVAVAAAEVVAAPMAEGVTAPLAAGERVRFVRRDHVATTTATVVETGPGWIVARPKGGDPVRLPLDDLARLEVARGRRSVAKEGALIGFLSGAAAGGWYGFTVLCIDAAPSDRAAFSPSGDYCNTNAALGLVSAAVVGAGTAIVGAITGALIKTDRWQRVPTRPVAAGLSIVPLRGGAAVSLGVARR